MVATDFLDPIHRLGRYQAGWIGRIPDVPVDCPRDEAMIRLRPHHERMLASSPLASGRLWRAEQIHGTGLAIVPATGEIPAADGLPVMPGVDGLLTRTPGTTLAIYVADCGAIWIADRRQPACALLHSGKKGSAGNILGHAIDAMRESFGSQPEDLVVILGPCIRPPHYEIDFAAQIARQAEAAAVSSFHDCGINTALDSAACYSYRLELGHTGRMLALLQIPAFPSPHSP